MKTCSACGRIRTLSDFTRKQSSADGHASSCVDCTRAATRAHYAVQPDYYKGNAAKRRAERRPHLRGLIRTYLSTHPCVDCRERDPIVLQFDHVRGEKLCAVSDMVSRLLPWETIMLEIDKCEVRCVNCHLRRTAKTQGWKYRLASVTI